MNRSIVTLTVLAGVIFTVGAWIPLKAMIAQELLNLAWAESQARQTATRPWPWADTWPVARLELVAADESLIVLDGAHGESLAFGPGRLFGTGDRGPVIIAGHRDTHFRALKSLTTGNELRLQNRHGDWTRYRVIATRIVDSRDHLLDVTTMPDDRLVLVTCYPFDAVINHGPLRYVVEARAVPGVSHARPNARKLFADTAADLAGRAF